VKLPPLILASASPRRADLLRLLKVDFEVLPSHVDEVAYEHLSLVFLDNEILGKPRDLAEAQIMLTRLQGRTHQVVTGVSLIHLRSHREKLFAASTDVLFHPLEADQINDYLTAINPLDKAGAYAVQEHGDKIISEISGSFSNVVGLPVESLRAELQSWELQVWE
jgi:septum formation protein